MRPVSTSAKDMRWKVAEAEPSCPFFLMVPLSSIISVLCELAAVETYVRWAEKSRELGMAVTVQKGSPSEATRMRAESQSWP